ncbi:unnamed protein product [Porites evermanni]|uniref:Uncharacterized protein n=1 Tax=Porites evermanni TaxID=104178 RepID=A0ABN8SNN4_9CNID|nr:unnamed protein product [Porites evermanni]
MLFRNHLSLREYSNQGFEAAHSLERQLHVYTKATSHDRHAHATSIQQILQQFFSEKLLFLWLCFRMAIESMENGKPFHFRGCGWSRKKEVS